MFDKWLICEHLYNAFAHIKGEMLYLKLMNPIKTIRLLLCVLLGSLCSCDYRYSDKEQPKPNIDSIHVLLTGGHKKAKTWVICTHPHRTTWGPKKMLTDSSTKPTYDYPYGLNQPWDVEGWLKNEFTFSYSHRYKPKNQKVRAHWSYANSTLGFLCKPYKDTAIEHMGHKDVDFILRNEKNGIGTGYTIELRDDGYVGFYNNGRGKYFIMSIKSDTMILAHLFNENYNELIKTGNVDIEIQKQSEIVWFNTFIHSKTLTIE